MALSKASSPNATAPLEYLRKEGGFVGLVNEQFWPKWISKEKNDQFWRFILVDPKGKVAMSKEETLRNYRNK